MNMDGLKSSFRRGKSTSSLPDEHEFCTFGTCGVAPGLQLAAPLAMIWLLLRIVLVHTRFISRLSHQMSWREVNARLCFSGTCPRNYINRKMHESTTSDRLAKITQEEWLSVVLSPHNLVPNLHSNYAEYPVTSIDPLLIRAHSVL